MLGLVLLAVFWNFFPEVFNEHVFISSKCVF